MHNKPTADCQIAHLAVQDTLYVVNDKWKMVILSILINDGPKRFGELAREAGVSPRILSKELQELEMNELVSRKVCSTKPVTVEYSATRYCMTLAEVIDSMRRWGVKHRERIKRKVKAN